MRSNQFANTVWRRHPGAIKRLREMAMDDGASFTETARVLSIETGHQVTKSMVCGMVHRNGFKTRGNPLMSRRGPPIEPQAVLIVGVSLPAGYRYVDRRLTTSP